MLTKFWNYWNPITENRFFNIYGFFKLKFLRWRLFGLLYLNFFTTLFIIFFWRRCLSSFFTFIINYFLFSIEKSQCLRKYFLKSWEKSLFGYHLKCSVIINLECWIVLSRILRNSISFWVEIIEYFLTAIIPVEFSLKQYSNNMIKLLKLTFKPSTFWITFLFLNCILFFLLNNIK